MQRVGGRMKRITVCTSDEMLFRRIYLHLSAGYDVLPYRGESRRERGDIVIVDIDSHGHLSGDILLTRGAVGDSERVRGGRDDAILLYIPISLDELERAVKFVEKRDTGSLILLKEERAVRLFGEVIRLTEVEMRVLEILVTAPRGEYVSRERLIEEVWGGECDGGVVNVYIHYLRTKLEKNGEKIIISSRREGYKLDERIGR